MKNKLILNGLIFLLTTLIVFEVSASLSFNDGTISLNNYNNFNLKYNCNGFETQQNVERLCINTNQVFLVDNNQNNISVGLDIYLVPLEDSKIDKDISKNTTSFNSESNVELIIKNNKYKGIVSGILSFSSEEYGRNNYIASGIVKNESGDTKFIIINSGFITDSIKNYEKPSEIKYQGEGYISISFVNIQSSISTSLDEGLTNRVQTLENNITSQNQRISLLESWKNTISDTISSLINTLAGHNSKITALENKSSNQNGTLTNYFKYLSSSDKKNMVCGYAIDNNLTRYSDLGLNCQVTYKTSWKKVYTTCKCS